MDLNDLPIIRLPGSETWAEAYEWGGQLDARFPDQDAHDLAYAVEYNDAGPMAGHAITDLVMVQQGEHDQADWIWHVTFDDGSVWVATGGCDYTGWDCQSWLEWTQPLSRSPVGSENGPGGATGSAESPGPNPEDER